MELHALLERSAGGMKPVAALVLPSNQPVRALLSVLAESASERAPATLPDEIAVGVFGRERPDEGGVYVVCLYAVGGGADALRIGASRAPPELTRRELEVLECCRQGLTAEGAAKKLHISPHTFSTHQRSIYRKLGVHNCTAAVAKAIELGLIRANGRRPSPGELAAKPRVARAF